MVPSVMAQWITTVVAPDSGVAASALESKGLGILKVRDLKRIRSTIYATGCVSSPQRVPSGANKNVLVEAIHALLKMDNHILVSRVQADLNLGTTQQQPASYAARASMESSSASLHPSLPQTNSKSKNATTCSSGRKRPAHHISYSVALNPPSMPYTGAPYPAYPGPALGGFSPYSVHPNGSNGTIQRHGPIPNHYKNYLQQVQNPMFSAASYPNRSLPNSGGSTGQQITSSNHSDPQAANNGSRCGVTPVCHENRSNNTSARTNVTGISTEERNIPKTPQEISFLNQLLAMGFQDREEVMRGIRQSNAFSADEVMMWIIQQREEREEARKMDEARLRSEQLRKENTEKQKRAFQERLNAASSRDDFRKIYSQSSWVLDNLDDAHFRRLVSHHKESLVRLLKLESNTRKWYQDKLPACYFRDLCHRSNHQAENEFDSWLTKECDALESGLYKLELQQGGVPKLFTQAQESHPEYKEQGENDESDDEILFCGTRQPKEASQESARN